MCSADIIIGRFSRVETKSECSNGHLCCRVPAAAGAGGRVEWLKFKRAEDNDEICVTLFFFETLLHSPFRGWTVKVKLENCSWNIYLVFFSVFFFHSCRWLWQFYLSCLLRHYYFFLMQANFFFAMSRRLLFVGVSQFQCYVIWNIYSARCKIKCVRCLRLYGLQIISSTQWLPVSPWTISIIFLAISSFLYYTLYFILFCRKIKSLTFISRCHWPASTRRPIESFYPRPRS